MRETTDGAFYFLEVNPAGQFLYLDLMAGTSLSIAMAAALSVRGEIVHRQEAKYESESIPIAMGATKPLALSLGHVNHIA
jgi:hypothetical protein